jgi:ABC-2 type transport system permease protein
LADEIEGFVEDLDENIRDLIARSGANLTDSFFGTTLLILALLGGGFAVQATLRLRSEEAALRAEPLLATPVSRWRWVASHVAVAVGGSIVMLTAGGMGVGLAYGLTVGDLGEVPAKVAEALVYLPAMGVLIGLGVALFGWVPRAAPVTWVLLIVCFVISFFGQLLDLPAWVMGISPFEHIPLVPAEELRAMPLVVLTTIAVGLGATGLWGFRARDVGSS